MGILFINLADEHVLGDKAVQALKHKEGENVYHFNFLEQALSFKASAPFLLTPRPSSLDNQTQIIIAAHGQVDDITYSYSDIEFEKPGEKLLTHTELARFINSIMEHWKYPHTNAPIKITLAICYAARTTDCQQDHIANANALNFEDTLAFNFLNILKAILQQRQCVNPIILKAYTGAVSFNESTGNIEVQTENQIAQEREKNEIKQQMIALGELIEKISDVNELTLLEEQYDTLTAKMLSLLIQAEPEPHYGEVIYKANPGGPILIDTTHLNRHDTIAVAASTSLAAEQGAGHSSAATSTLFFSSFFGRSLHALLTLTKPIPGGHRKSLGNNFTAPVLDPTFH